MTLVLLFAAPQLTAAEVFPLLLRWLHVAAVGLWLGAAFVVAWLPADADGLAGPAVRRARQVQRNGAGIAWLAGAALLFSNYYTAFAPPYFFAPLDPRGGSVPEALVWFVVLASLLAAAALQERLARRLTLVPSVVAAVALGVGLTAWWSAQGLSARAVWVHLGAYLGTCMALSALLAPERDAGTRQRASLQVVLAVPAVMTMLAVHLPELLGAGPPLLPAGLVLVLGAGAGTVFLRLVLPAAR